MTYVAVFVATVRVRVDVDIVSNNMVAAAVFVQVWRGTGNLVEQNDSAGA